MRNGWFLLALLTVLVVAGVGRAELHDERPITRIGFGSCLRETEPAPILDAVVAAKPEVFLWLGDNVYADVRDGKRYVPQGADDMAKHYDALAAVPGFVRLREAVPMLATWDDHDYGVNDGGAEWHLKEEAKQLMLDFFGDPPEAPRRGREGVYQAYTYGPPGKRVQVILLDTRWFRSPLKQQRILGVRHYVPDEDPTKTMLGEAQWAWLEAQLKAPADVRLIASSIQVLSEEHRFEKWANFPHERRRLVELIGSTGAAGVVLLSGDRHRSEISRLNDPALEASAGYPLYDVTSSSLNLGLAPTLEPNRHRIGNQYAPENFGMLLIDFDAGLLTIQLRDGANEVVEATNVPLPALQPGA
ncbi:MAG: alkaline phosphatase D family protein [Phycisphaerae bacterium]